MNLSEIKKRLAEMAREKKKNMTNLHVRITVLEIYGKIKNNFILAIATLTNHGKIMIVS